MRCDVHAHRFSSDALCTLQALLAERSRVAGGASNPDRPVRGMEAKVNGRQAPVAVALWASVSEDVDKRLSENLTTPIKLRPDELRSGDILWLIDAVGDPKAIQHLLGQLHEGPLKGRPAKARTLGPNAHPVVRKLDSPIRP